MVHTYLLPRKTDEGPKTHSGRPQEQLDDVAAVPKPVVQPLPLLPSLPRFLLGVEVAAVVAVAVLALVEPA